MSVLNGPTSSGIISSNISRRSNLSYVWPFNKHGLQSLEFASLVDAILL